MKDLYNKRIKVENPGILLSGMTIEDLKQWGSGVRCIFSEAEKLDLPEPQIEEIGMHLRFTVRLKESIAAKKEQVTEYVGSTHQVTHQVIQLLEFMKGASY